MLLAATSAATLFQDVLHDLFGGDYPDDSLLLYQIAVRAVFVYAATLLIVRVGKSRIISRTTTIDVILGFILGSLVSRAVTGKASISGTLVATCAMVFAHWLFTAIACRWHWFGILLKGSEHLIVENGQPIKKAMRHSHISSHDLIEEMHLQGLDDIAKIRQAFKERNGQIGFIKQQPAPQIIDVAVKDGVQTVRIALS